MTDETIEPSAARVGDGETITDCAETLRELDVFLDGEISAEQQAAIRHHLEGCMDCLGAFDFHAELKMVIHDKMPSDLRSKIESCFGEDFDGDGRIV